MPDFDENASSSSWMVVLVMLGGDVADGAREKKEKRAIAAPKMIANRKNLRRV